MTQVALAVVLCCLAAPPPGRAREPIPDPIARVCGVDADCPLGKICHKNTLYDPAKACIPGCRPGAPRCPAGYTCERDPDYSAPKYPWHRCRAPNGGPFMGD